MLHTPPPNCKYFFIEYNIPDWKFTVNIIKINIKHYLVNFNIKKILLEFDSYTSKIALYFQKTNFSGDILVSIFQISRFILFSTTNLDFTNEFRPNRRFSYHFFGL